MNKIKQALEYLHSQRGFATAEHGTGNSILCPKQRVILEENKKTGKFEAKFASAVNINEKEAYVIYNVLMMLNI